MTEIMSENRINEELEERKQFLFLQPKKEFSSLIYELSSHFLSACYIGGTFKPDGMPENQSWLF